MMYDSCNSWNKANNDDDADVDYDLINCLLLLSVGANIILEFARNSCFSIL